jgi:hypothetical protein
MDAEKVSGAAHLNVNDASSIEINFMKRKK